MLKVVDQGVEKPWRNYISVDIPKLSVALANRLTDGDVPFQTAGALYTLCVRATYGKDLIDPLVSLAFAVWSNPGVYALLAGSGLSRSAGIPTGWEIVQNLIRKLALLHGTQSVARPEEWYKATYGSEPDYSDLLDQLAKTPDERCQLLRSYFEPTTEERTQGIKMPTAAHRAIAELVKAEFVRIIVTTNFDRLLETALTDVGIQPTVVSTPDGVKGALPLAHVRSLILKVNGDYLDSRIKNTRAELSAYDPALAGMLDRIFDEFGLIVCGWSGDWDLALRAAIERCTTRRFSMYWAARALPAAKASDLITLRAAVPIKIQSADSFFVALKEKTVALAQFGQNHPLSAILATALTKRYLVRKEDRILLHDLVYEETELAYALMDPEEFHGNHVADTSAELYQRLRAYESITEVLLGIVVAGCYWGTEEQEYLWRHVIKRLGDPPGIPSGLVAWVGFRQYPASLVMYAGGVAAILGKRFSNLAAVLRTEIPRQYEGKTVNAANRLHFGSLMRDGLGNYMPGKKRYSNYVFELLRERFKSVGSSDLEYDEAFNLFEYFLGLIVWQAPATATKWAPVGRAAWHADAFFTPDGPTTPSDSRIAAIAEVLFEKGIDDYRTIKPAYDGWVLQYGYS